MPRSAARRRALGFPRSFLIFTWTGWTSSLRQFSSPEYTRGSRRAASPAYQKVQKAIARARGAGNRAAVRLLRKQQRSLPAGDTCDPRYRRLRYLRYADDHLLGFTGPKAEAEEIRDRLARFLREDLKLELNQAKTLITHARTGAARFLGYEITVQHSRDRPQVNGVIGLRVPRAVITAKCTPYLRLGKPEHQPQLKTSAITRSSAPTGPGTGASSSTTCSPVTSAG
jgi:hypothetical protein